MLLHPKHGNTLKFPKFKLKLKRFRAKGLPLEFGCWFTSLDSNFSLPFSLAPHNRPPLQLVFQKFWPIKLSLSHSHKVWPLPKIQPTKFFFLPRVGFREKMGMGEFCHSLACFSNFSTQKSAPFHPYL